MRKAAFGIFLVLILLGGCKKAVPVEISSTTVTISLNITPARENCIQSLDKEGNVIATYPCEEWYWTQFHLPTGGSLMIQTDKDGYEEKHKRFKYDYDAAVFARKEKKGQTTFYGKFMIGGESIPERYVFLPEKDEHADSLIFFAKDGSIWEITVPPSIYVRQKGQLETQATIYR